MSKPPQKVCKNGHAFVKSSDCPVCPICEAQRAAPSESELPNIGAPATRALERIGILTLQDLANHTTPELEALHGLGPKAMRILIDALAAKGMSCKPATATGSIDAYLESLPERSRASIEQIRLRVATVAPEAIEAIKYGMPTAAIQGRNILYYAAWKTHIGMYPIYRGSPDFEAALAPYRDKKDTVRFILSKPIPFDIVDLILENRISEMRAPTTNVSLP
jgi:uncharacterized protein YdhG (YjbR/CyaY superfamily)